MNQPNTKMAKWDANTIHIPVDLLQVKLSPTALRLWIALAKFRNTKTNKCFPSSRSLLELLPEGTNSGTLRRARAELEEKGLLIVQSQYDDGRQTSNLYELLYPKEVVEEARDNARREERETTRVEARETTRVEARENALPINSLIETHKKGTQILEFFDSGEIELVDEKQLATEMFDEFWDVYGKKVNKPATQKHWAKHIKDVALAELVIAKATEYAASREKQYRQDPERWVRDKRWEDEIVGSEPLSAGQKTFKRMQAKVDRGEL